MTDALSQSSRGALEEFSWLSRISIGLFETQEEDEVVGRIVDGLRSIGFDRVRLYLLSHDQKHWVGRDQRGQESLFVGSQWPVGSLDSSASRVQLFQSGAAASTFKLSSAEENVKQWVWIPFLRAGTVIGGISADNYRSERDIKKDILEFLVPFGAYAYAALQAVQNVSEANRRTLKLNAVLRVSSKMKTLLDLDQILNATCESAVELVNVGHCGFVRVEPSGDFGKVYAEFPDLGMLGTRIPLTQTPAWSDFIRQGKPFVARDVANEPNLGPGRELFIANDIRSVMIVPVIGQNGVLGSFGLDSIGANRDFTKDELETCRTFAEHVAVAIENAERLVETNQHVERLEKIQHTLLEVATPLNRDALLRTIMEQTVKVLKGKSSGIYQYNSETRELELITEYSRQDQLGNMLQLGEGVAGRLLKSDQPFMIVDDYDNWDGKATIYANKIVGSVVAVPIKRDGHVLGVLYLDDDLGRKFTPKDARLLGLFADASAIALLDTIGTDEKRLRRLEMLSKATEEIISRLPEKRLDDLLSLIAEQAAHVLEAESCGVFLVKQGALLSLEASFGHADGHFQKGRTLPILKGHKSGLTGYIAQRGRLFNAHGDALTKHPAVSGDRPYHSRSAACHSLLAIPLKRRIGQQEKLIGLLRIDNKKDHNGRVSPDVRFTREDEGILSIFAETIVVALERAEFAEQLGREHENLKRFLDSSPTGVIAADVRGNVTGFNSQAEEILGYKANEVMQTPINRLYFDPNEPAKIGKRLIAANGKITNYDTAVRSKNGDRINIRLSATWLYDDSKNINGSVGYFDRSIREIETLIVQASQTSALSELSTGLHKLVSKIISVAPHTFCRILLKGEAQEFLVIEAAHSELGENWNPKVGEPLVTSEWPGLDRILKRPEYTIIRWSDKRSRPSLERLSEYLGLNACLQTLLLIPLRVEGADVGLLEIGEVRREEQSGFPISEIDLILQIAHGSKSLIAMSLYRITNRYKESLESLHLASREIAKPLDLPGTLQTIVQQAAKTFGADSSALWSYGEAQDPFNSDDPVAYGIPDNIFRLFKEKKPAQGKTAFTVLDRDQIDVPRLSRRDAPFLSASTRSLLRRIGVASFQGVALKVANDPIGVLYLNYNTAREFGDSDHRALENFASYAALSLRRARLASRLQTAQTMSKAVTRMTARMDADATLDAVVSWTRQAVGCDAVVLYTYDPNTKKLAYPPKHIGVDFPHQAWPYSKVPTNSFVYRTIQTDQRVIAEAVKDNSFFKKSRFAKDEKIESCVVIPLKAAGQKLGVMFVNYRTRHRFSSQELESLEGFAEQAAIAINNSQLYGLAQRRADVLKGLNDASHTIIESPSLKRTLNSVAQQALRVVGGSDNTRYFSHVALLVNNSLRFTASSSPRKLTLLKRGRHSLNSNDSGSRIGIIIAAAKTGVTQNIENVSATNGEAGVFKSLRSQISVPLLVVGNAIGVLTVEHPNVQAFSDEDQQNLETLASNAALAIQNAERFETIERDKEKFERLHEAAKSMAGVLDRTEVLKIILQIAHEMFQADSCSIWPYDHTPGRFLREEPIALGITPSVFEQFKVEESTFDQLSFQVLDKWITLPSLVGPDAQFLNKKTVRLLKRARVKSFHGIALKVADEPVGVLYVNYKIERRFDDVDRGQIENFARYAALAILRARLTHQVNTATLMSKVAASMTALGDTKGTLLSVTAGTKAAVNCNAVVLYIYDSRTGKFTYPPSYKGVIDPKKAWPGNEVPRNNDLVHAILQKTEPYIVEETSKDKLFRGRSFAANEHIESCAAIPLIALGQKVGVMFVNYRKRHRFDNDELINIKLFAEQAAVAISNLQLYTREKNQAKVLSEHYIAGKTITATLSLPETLKRICEQAVHLIEARDKRRFSHVALREGSNHRFIAASSEKILKTLKKTSSRVSLRKPNPRGRPKRNIGIAGRAAIINEVQIVGDVSQDPDYNRVRAWVKAQLSAPLRVGNEKIGVLSIEHSQLNAFTEDDKQNVQLLAAQAAVAIKTAQQFQELERTKSVVGARTALVSLGMTASKHGHAIEGHASIIRNALDLLREEILAEDFTESQLRIFERRLSMIERQTKKILSKWITAPNPWSRKKIFAINDFVHEWNKRLEASEFYPVGFIVKINPAKGRPQVKCNQDWLMEAFDILTENAIEATEGMPIRRLVISTRVHAGRVEIAFVDTGKGIPDVIYKKLFKEQIRKHRTSGLGIGLLLAHLIVQASDGDIRPITPGPGNTTIMIDLPEHRKRRP